MFGGFFTKSLSWLFAVFKAVFALIPTRDSSAAKPRTEEFNVIADDDKVQLTDPLPDVLRKRFVRHWPSILTQFFKFAFFSMSGQLLPSGHCLLLNLKQAICRGSAQ